MKYIIASIAIPIVVLMAFACSASVRAESISEPNLKCFLKSIACDGTNYVFALKSGYVYSSNDSEVKVCRDGESVSLNGASKLLLFEHHTSLLFTPMPTEGTRRGFRVLHIIDLRSFGRNVTTNYAYLVAADEKTVSPDDGTGTSGTNAVRRMNTGAPLKAGVSEKKFLKGLALLPCEEKKQ